MTNTLRGKIEQILEQHRLGELSDEDLKVVYGIVKRFMEQK